MVGARAVLEDALGLNGYAIADVQTLALMGRREDALARLREAIDAGWRSSCTKYGCYLRDNPFLGSLREDPSFLAMVGEVEADVARMGNRALQAEASGDWQPLLALAERGPVLRAEAIRR